MDPKEAVSKLNTLSDVEGLCVSFAGSRDSSDPVCAVKVFMLIYLIGYGDLVQRRLVGS